MTDFYNEKLKELFGLDYLFPWQRLVIANTLEGIGYFGEERQEEAPRRNLVVLPTGAGKSLCFLMPALLTEGITLILYPLLALLNDQARRLREEGQEPVVFRGGQSREEREGNWRRLKEGEGRFILTNPETAGGADFRERLKGLNIVHLVIDEVHTIPQWGPSFRTGLLSVKELVEEIDFPVVTAYTATASPQFREQIGELVFGGKGFHTIMGDPDRANIHYHLLYTSLVLPSLEELCLGERKPILIFCRTRAQTEETARYLDRRIGTCEGIGPIRFYHAGLSREEKEDTEAWFLAEKEAVLCCSSAYGMGVDCRQLRTVIHRDIPYSIESYIQEAGRAGRSGAESRAFMLVSPGAEASGTMADFIKRRDCCRRTLLMEALGWESSYCGGCDYCTPRDSIPQNRVGERDLKKLIWAYRAIWTPREWRDFLKGKGGKGYGILPGFGLLKTMESDEIGEAFTCLRKEGDIIIPSKGIHKGRICVKRRDRRKM
ncbi:MAG: helicase-related protein [Spirochaetales bacterium]|nr:helicase-related protein [Spirochaetales bacterium]